MPMSVTQLRRMTDCPSPNQRWSGKLKLARPENWREFKRG